MNLPVKTDSSAEQGLGTTSLELIRVRLKHAVLRRQDLTRSERKRVVQELDYLIESERRRRELIAYQQLEREQLQNQITRARTLAELARDLRLLKAQSDNETAKLQCEALHCQLDLIERSLRLSEKIHNTSKKDDYLEEIEKIRRKHHLEHVRDEALLQSITQRALQRAAFLKKAQEEFPDMADELIDYYDQQIFQRTTKR